MYQHAAFCHLNRSVQVCKQKRMGSFSEQVPEQEKLLNDNYFLWIAIQYKCVHTASNAGYRNVICVSPRQDSFT